MHSPFTTQARIVLCPSCLPVWDASKYLIADAYLRLVLSGDQTPGLLLLSDWAPILPQKGMFVEDMRPNNPNRATMALRLLAGSAFTERCPDKPWANPCVSPCGVCVILALVDPRRTRAARHHCSHPVLSFLAHPPRRLVPPARLLNPRLVLHRAPQVVAVNDTPVVERQVFIHSFILILFILASRAGLF